MADIQKAEQSEQPPSEKNQTAEKTGGAGNAGSEQENLATDGDEGKTLAGLRFKNRECLFERMLAKGKEAAASEKTLDGEDLFLAYSLLERHPSAAEKMQGGVTGLGYGVNPDFPDTSAFYVLHPDGTRSFWSLRKSIDMIFDNEAPTLSTKRKADWETPRTEYVSGLIVKLAGLPDALTYNDIKEALKELQARFVVKKEGEALVRFDSVDNAAKAAEMTNLNGHDIQCTLLSGEEEEKFWAEANSGKGKGKKGRKGGKKGGKKGRNMH